MNRSELERFEAFRAELEELRQRVDELCSSSKEMLRIDRKLNYDQTWAIHRLAKAVAKNLGTPNYDAIEAALSFYLLENRLELSPITSPAGDEPERQGAHPS